MLLLGGERPKSSESFCPGENEARRGVGESGVGGGEFSLLAIVSNEGTYVELDEVEEGGGSLSRYSAEFNCCQLYMRNCMTICQYTDLHALAAALYTQGIGDRGLLAV